MNNSVKVTKNPITWVAFLAGCLLVAIIWIFTLRKRRDD